MLTIELSCLYRLVIRKHIKEDRTELGKVGKDMGSTAHQSSIPLIRMASEPVRLKQNSAVDQVDGLKAIDDLLLIGYLERSNSETKSVKDSIEVIYRLRLMTIFL